MFFFPLNVFGHCPLLGQLFFNVLQNANIYVWSFVCCCGAVVAAAPSAVGYTSCSAARAAPSCSAAAATAVAADPAEDNIL